MRMLWGLCLLSSVAAAECTKDTDCKGDRICTGGTCVDSDAPLAQPAQVSAIAQADRVARVAQLQTELVDLHTDLEDATLSPPIMKLLGGTALSVVAAVFYVQWQYAADCNSYHYTTCGDSTSLATVTALAAAGGLALLIWGGVQLKLRVTARQRLPGEIQSREQQLRLLEGE